MFVVEVCARRERVAALVAARDAGAARAARDAEAASRAAEKAAVRAVG